MAGAMIYVGEWVQFLFYLLGLYYVNLHLQMKRSAKEML